MEKKRKGVMDDFLTDGMILEECSTRNKNMSHNLAKKQYDSVNHHWLVRTLGVHKTPKINVNTTVKLSKQCKIKLTR